MKTEIFKSFTDFLNREDKETNGVSEVFAANSPEFEKQNDTNKGCWNCSGCSDCFGCSGCFDCFDCFDCSRCFGCSRCFDCSGCSRCFDCFDCFDLKNAAPVSSDKPAFEIPVIPNIHSTILAAVTGSPTALDMSDWHTCETTHCRAGWVVHLAGEAGKILEEKTSTLFAAMQIYHKSSPDIKVSPPRFFEPNGVAMEDIKRCAELEKQQG